MPQQGGIPQRLKQSVQGFLGVNLRKDRVTLADEELAKAINAEFHERPGSLILRRGRRKQFSTALTDLMIRRLALVNGVRYQIAGQSIYRDGTRVVSGLLSANLFTTMHAFRPLTDRTAWVFIADAGVMFKDNGTQLVPWGIAVLSAPVCAVGGVGTGLTGDYLGGYSSIRFDDVDDDGDPAVAHESNVVADDAVTLSNNTLAIADIIDPPDAQVTGLGVYRSVAGGSLLLLDSREVIPTEGTTFSVTHGWEVTAAPGGTVADGLQLHWSVDLDTKRGSQGWEPVATPGLHFIGSAAAPATSLTLPAHKTGDLLVMFAYRSGSTSAPTIPSGWTTWGAGAGANLNASAGGYKVATSDAETSGEWTAATWLECHVYRGQRVAGAIGGVADNGGDGTTVTYPALTLTDTAGTSLVVTFAGHRQINTRLETAPNGTVLRTNGVGTSSTQGEVAGHDTDGGISAWFAQSIPVGGSPSGWRTRSLEIRAEPTTTSTAGTSEDLRGLRGTHLWESLIEVVVGTLVVNGTFDTDVSGWTFVVTGSGLVFWSAPGRVLLFVNGVTGTVTARQDVTVVANNPYSVSIDGDVDTHGTSTIQIGSTSGGSELLPVTLLTSGVQALRYLITSPSTTLSITFSVAGELGGMLLYKIIVTGSITAVARQTNRWAYASTIADSALGSEGPSDNDVPPLAEWVTEFQGHAFLARLDRKERLVWSQRFAPEAFPVDNYLDIGTPDDPLQCAVGIAGLLGVFTQNTKYRVSGNTLTGFTYQEALSRRGTDSPLAVIACEYGIVFPHHDGIWGTNLLSQDQELSGDIAPLFYGETVNDMPPINWAAAATFAGAYRKGRYYFAYASGEATTPNTLAVLSRTTNKWYFFDHPARSLHVEQGEDEALTAGFADGFVYVLEAGADDAGSDIALDCETKDYFGGEVDVRKLYVWARVDADVPSGETLSVGLFVDDTLKRTATVTGTRTRVLLSYPEGSMGYTWRLRFQYTGSQRVRIYGASTICLPLEMG